MYAAVKASGHCFLARNSDLIESLIFIETKAGSTRLFCREQKVELLQNNNEVKKDCLSFLQDAIEIDCEEERVQVSRLIVTRKRKKITDNAELGVLGSADSLARTFSRSPLAIVRAFFPPRILVFIAFFAAYLYALVDIRLVFLARDRLFLLNLSYFTDFIGTPGSLMEWTDNLLVQLCYNGWPCVVAMAVAAWLLLVSTVGLMNVIARANIGGAWVIPAAFLVALCGRYYFPISAIVGLALAIVVAQGWCSMPLRGTWLRSGVFALISAILYYVVGNAYYCFAACCILHEMLVEKRRLSAAFFLLAAVGVKFGLDFLCAKLQIASSNYHMLSLVEPNRDDWPWLLMLLYAYFPVCALCVLYRRAVLGLVWQIFIPPMPAITNESSPKNEKEKTGEEIASSRRGGAWKNARRVFLWTTGTILPLLFASIVGYYCLNRELKATLEIDYCTEHQLWNDVLVKAKALPLKAYLPYVNHDVNLALYHVGLLPSQMFLFPQGYWPLFSKHQVADDLLWRMPCDLLLQWGRVNEAEHIALEMLEMHPTGGTLKRLAMVEMIKDQPSAASVFLRVLEDDLVWRDWARDYLQRLAADPHLTGDEDIQRTRDLMIAEDDLARTSTLVADGQVPFLVSTCLSSLLEHNKNNRMAFEYMMSMALIVRDVKAAVETLSYLKYYSYPTIPCLYEEAILIYAIQHPECIQATESGIFFQNRKISDTTMKKFRRFQEILNPYGGPVPQAKDPVARELGDSYFYFFFYSQ